MKYLTDLPDVFDFPVDGNWLLFKVNHFKTLFRQLLALPAPLCLDIRNAFHFIGRKENQIGYGLWADIP